MAGGLWSNRLSNTSTNISVMYFAEGCQTSLYKNVLLTRGGGKKKRDIFSEDELQLKKKEHLTLETGEVKCGC